jgi:hypothetical protein
MEKLGRGLLLLHAMLSIGVLAWALGIYTNRIKFKTGSPETPGVIDQTETKLGDLKTASERAFSRWSSNIATVTNLEQERFPRRAFYQGQLYMIYFGTTGPGQPAVPTPVQQLIMSPRNGYLDITNPTGRPAIDVRTNPRTAARSITGYEKDLVSLADSIVKAQTESARLIVERKKLNDEIAGPTEPPIFKGLRQLIREQQSIIENADGELGYVTNFFTNREAEFGLLKKRRNALINRKNELESLAAEERQLRDGDKVRGDR